MSPSIPSQFNIKINNLGYIKKANITLKPLTIFIGKNNTGKSWTAYTVSSIFSVEFLYLYRERYLKNELKGHYPELDNAIENLLKKGVCQINLIEFINKYYNYFLNDLASPPHFNNLLGTSRITFKDFRIDLEVKLDVNKYLDLILLLDHKKDFPKGVSEKNVLSSVKEKNDTLIYFYYKEFDSSKSYPETAIKEQVFNQVMKYLHLLYFHDVYFFPTERTGIMTLLELYQKMLGQEKFQQKSVKIDDEFDTGISFFYLNNMIRLLATIRQQKLYSTKSMEEREKVEEDFPKLVNFFQKEILGGNLNYLEPDSNLFNELVFNLSENKNIILEIPSVSSIIKDYTPLVLYLKYVAMKDDLIVIDEPEMNLHPEAQAKFIEFVTILINNGLNIIITTHSPYIVDHLSNLIKANNSKNKDNIVDQFFLKRKDAFISKDKVSIYLFENHKVKNILKKSGEINWDSFSKISEKIFQIRWNI